MYYTKFMTPFCEVILVGDENGLSNLELTSGEGKRSFSLKDEWKQNDFFFAGVKKQVMDFFAGLRTDFDIKLNLKGTEFQLKVWNELAKIPFGELRSYKDIATAVGNSKASRAVGMANSKNPIPLIIPCHRVVGANGKLTGFAYGLNMKEKLLTFESKEYKNG